jgi:cysteinyl-tRNA synthetase
MEDDLNTPLAIAELHRLSKASRTGSESLAARMAQPGARMDSSTHLPNRQLWAGLELLGIDIKNYDRDWAQKQVQSRISSSQTEKIESLVSARNDARKAKKFNESDRIRDELAAMGVVLKDSKDGTTWEIAR